jgi:hypothetical protein
MTTTTTMMMMMMMRRRRRRRKKVSDDEPGMSGVERLIYSDQGYMGEMGTTYPS